MNENNFVLYTYFKRVGKSIFGVAKIDSNIDFLNSVDSPSENHTCFTFWLGQE